jgi:hypothetical protein
VSGAADMQIVMPFVDKAPICNFYIGSLKKWAKRVGQKTREVTKERL